MSTSPVFPRARMRSGMYESFYLRAVSPREPVGVWVRNTVHKRPGRAPRGSVWCTVFDASRGRPYMHKLTSAQLRAPAGGWIAVGADGEDAAALPARESGEGGWLGPGAARGHCGAARWSLSYRAQEPELRHLPRAWLYRAPLPRTKLTSPAPAASFDGRLELDGREPITLHGWRGMVGHNWGAEHAERWIWLHGVGFEQAPEAWLDLALGRVKLAGRLTPWIASGAFSLDGRRHRLGGLLAPRPQVAESPEGATVKLQGADRLALELEVRVPLLAAAGWRYADPCGGEHEVVNCSVAALSLRVSLAGARAPRTLSSEHCGAYELGMREHDHGVPLAPFADG